MIWFRIVNFTINTTVMGISNLYFPELICRDQMHLLYTTPINSWLTNLQNYLLRHTYISTGGNSLLSIFSRLTIPFEDVIWCCIHLPEVVAGTRGGGGGGTLFSYIRRLGPFFWVQNSECQYFWVFSEKWIFLGVLRFFGCFWGNQKIGPRLSPRPLNIFSSETKRSMALGLALGIRALPGWHKKWIKVDLDLL